MKNRQDSKAPAGEAGVGLGFERRTEDNALVINKVRKKKRSTHSTFSIASHSAHTCKPGDPKLSMQVAEGGAAAVSGCIKAGDIIVSVDGKSVIGMQCK
jgi:C-terminal processing protease CtpA/Prc